MYQIYEKHMNSHEWTRAKQYIHIPYFTLQKYIKFNNYTKVLPFICGVLTFFN